MSVKIKWSKGKSQAFFFFKNQVLEPMRDLKQPIFIKSDKITKKSLDFYFYFHIHCHRHHRQMNLRIWCSWCSIADFSSVCTGSSPVIRYLSLLIIAMFGRIIWGLLLAGAGAVMCYYSYQLVAIFGRNARAERNLGGTRNAVVLAGVWLVILGILMVFGVFSLSNPADQVSWGFGNGNALN